MSCKDCSENCGNFFCDGAETAPQRSLFNALGFTKEEDPEKIEYDLMKVLPKDHWILYNIQIITHGRSICTARKPDCANCFLYEYCKTQKPLA